MFEKCAVYRLGLIPYRKAWELQEKLANEIANGKQPPTLLLLQHPPVFTFGRRGDSKNLLWDEGELARRGIEAIWVDRGGDVTYHGPGQLVGYPLLPVAPGGIYRKTQADASGDGESLPKADYIGYLRRLEQMLIAALAQMGVTAVQIPGKSGVWVQPEALMRNRNGAAEQPGLPAKIAAIGVKVDARGISRHGFALNVQAEAEYWAGIIACGLAGYSITSLGELRKPLPLMQEVEDKILSAFQQVFGYEIVEAEAEEIFSEIELVEKTQSEPAHHP